MLLHKSKVVRVWLLIILATVPAIATAVCRIAPQKVRRDTKTVAFDEEGPVERPTTDCGAACLYVIAKKAGKSVTLEQVRGMTKTSAAGASLLQIKNAAIDLGFSAVGCKCTFNALRSHVSQERNFAILFSSRRHFVAIMGVDLSGRVLVLDNGKGVFDASERDLTTGYEWTGVTLLLTLPTNRNVASGG